MKNLVIASIDKKTAGSRAKLMPRDTILAVDGNPIIDEIDFSFFTATEESTLTVSRSNTIFTIQLKRSYGEHLGITFVDPPLKRCGNKCVFCFIDQMPKGLRKSLYIKDEDVMHSFVNGNYVTLSTTHKTELKRIIDRGLSPLFLSIHATDAQVRIMLLGNKKAPDILEQLTMLKEGGIQFHTQIVVCPSLNDGKILAKTINDLFKYKDSLLSIAIVPVGLTRHRSIPLSAMSESNAHEIIDFANPISDFHAHKDFVRKLFIADELFIKANLPIPPASYYEDFPQIENGVGLVRTLLDEWKFVKKECSKATLKKVYPQSIIIITSVSAEKFLQKIAIDLTKIINGLSVKVVAVSNTFFGETVTVAGLLTGKDILRTLNTINTTKSEVVVPSIIFNRFGHTLDGYSLARMGKNLGTSVRSAATVTELVTIFFKQPPIGK